MRKHGIYVLENTTTGKQYVGQSIDVNKRKQEHFNSMQKGKHHNDYIQQDYNRGHDFSFGVLEYCDLSSLNQREKYWINRLNTYNKGYNLTSGGGKTFVYVNQKQENDEYNKQKMEKIYLTRLENETKAYNGSLKRLLGTTHPLILMVMIIFIIIGILLQPIGLIISFGILIMYFIQFLGLYINKTGYNQCVDKLNKYGHNLNKIQYPIPTIIHENKKEMFAIFKHISEIKNNASKEYDTISSESELKVAYDDANEKQTEELTSKNADLKKCPKCNLYLFKDSNKCPSCKYVFKNK